MQPRTRTRRKKARSADATLPMELFDTEADYRSIEAAAKARGLKITDDGDQIFLRWPREKVRAFIGDVVGLGSKMNHAALGE